MFGALRTVLAHDRFWLPWGGFTGLLLVAPVLATGLYAVSRALARGQGADLRLVFSAGKPERRLMAFGLLLAFAGTGRVLTSASLITCFAPEPVHTPLDFSRVVVLNDHSLLFEAWLVLGALLAAPVYTSSVVAIQLLPDRQIGVLAAVLTSWRVVQALPPLPMALWAVLLMGLTVLDMATMLLGLVMIPPWLAHASRHAYRDLLGVADQSGQR